MAETQNTEDRRNEQGAGPRKAAGASGPGSTPIRKRKKKRTGLILTLLGLVVVAVVAVAMMMRGKGAEAIEVETQKVTTRTILQSVTATGVVDPETQVKISPEVSGEIVFLGAQEGEAVQKGQVLVRINPEAMAAQLDEAQAGISAAQARVAQARASLMRNEQELARVRQLFEKKLATQQDLETSEAQLNISQAEQDAARYQAQQAQAAARRVRESLSKTTIVSPISGVVTKLNSKIGEKVVGAIQMTGTEIMTVADLSVIEAVVDVSETDVVQVSIGDTAEVEVDALPNQKFPAVVSRIANSPKQSGIGTQEQLTNFEVRLRFIAPDHRFRPGMTALATIHTDRKWNVISVPIQSVTTRAKEETEEGKQEEEEDVVVTNKALEKTQRDDRPEPIVFVREGNIVRARKVETGIRDDQNIEITSGLKAGEIVVSGTYKAITKDLKDSTLVKDKVKESEVRR